MTPPDDYSDEMRTTTDLDDRTVENLLTGRSVDPELAELARALGQLRAVSDDCAPRPNAALASILANGLPGAATVEQPVAARDAAARSRWHRVPGRAFVARLAAAGLGAKVAFALTTGAALAAGAAATDLPHRISETLDRGGATAPADLPEDAEFGESVREDATDPAAPGVDGPGTATNARERGAPAPADGVDGGLDRAREKTEDTPAVLPAPGAAEEGRRPGTAPPAGTPDGPPAGTPGGPPAGTPNGPPAGTPSGPPADAPSGPPAGTPSGAPADTAPSAPPAGDPSGPAASTPDGPPVNHALPGATDDAPSGPPADAPTGEPPSIHQSTPEPGSNAASR